LDLTKNWDLRQNSNPEQVHRVVRMGIPPKFRKRIWQLICSSHEFLLKNPGVYEFCKSKPNEKAEYSIQKDIGRTFPKHADFKTSQGKGQTKLFNVLKAFANFNYKKEVTYCQGLNFIVGILIVNMEEEEAFWLLVQLMKKYSLSNIYAKGLPGLLMCTSIFDSIVPHLLPNIANHFVSNGISTNMFAYKWFLTLFGCVLPLDVVFRIFDCFLCEGWEIILRFGLALLKYSESKLINVPIDDICVYFDAMSFTQEEIESIFEITFQFELDKQILLPLHQLSGHHQESIG